MEYVILAIMLCVCMIRYDFGRRRLRSGRGGMRIVWFWVIVAALILLSGLRYYVGFDTYYLMHSFYNGPDSFDSEDMQYYTFSRDRDVFLYVLVRSFGGGAWIVQMLYAVILNVAVGRFILRYTDRIFTALLLYVVFAYLNFNFEVIRQGAAMAMFLWGYGDLRQRRYGAFSMKILLGALFHISVLVLLLLPIVNTNRFKNMCRPGLMTLLMLVCSAALAFALKYAILWGVPLLSKLFPTVGPIDNFSTRIALAGEEMLAYTSLNWKGLIGMAVSKIIWPLAAAAMLWNPYSESRPLRNSNCGRMLTSSAIDAGLSQIMVISACFAVMSLVGHEFIRIGAYFSILVLIGYTRLLNRMRPLLWWALMTPIIALQFYSLSGRSRLVENAHTYDIYYPYSSWIDQSRSAKRDSLFKEICLDLDRKTKKIQRNEDAEAIGK